MLPFSLSSSVSIYAPSVAKKLCSDLRSSAFICGSKLFCMTLLALQHYLAVGAILFVIGLIGFVTRRNLIVMFLCTELMFQGVAVNMVAFGRYWNNDLGGQAFTIFLLVIAAAEASLALGLVILLFRQKNTLDADAWRELKG